MAVLEVRGEHAVVSGEMGVGARDTDGRCRTRFPPIWPARFGISTTRSSTDCGTQLPPRAAVGAVRTARRPNRARAPAAGSGDAGAGTAGARGVRIRSQAGGDRAGVPPLTRPGGVGGRRGEAGPAVRAMPACVAGREPKGVRETRRRASGAWTGSAFRGSGLRPAEARPA